MTQRARQTQQAKPERIAQGRHLTARRNRPMIIIRPEAFRRKSMRRVFHSCKAAPAVKQRVIPLCFLTLPDAGLAAGMVGIIVVLVHSLDDGRGIHDAGAGMPRVPHEPVVPSRAPNDERRSILIIETARKSEIIDPLWRTLVIRLKRLAPHGRFPIRGVKIHWLSDIGIPTLSGHQESATESGHTFDCHTKIRKENDVAVDVAQAIVVRQVLRAVENRGEVFGAVFVALHFRHVANSEIAGGLGGALFITEQNHFSGRMNTRPALDGVALNDADVPAKRFRRREKGNHRRTGYIPTLWLCSRSAANISSRMESRLRVTLQPE